MPSRGIRRSACGPSARGTADELRCWIGSRSVRAVPFALHGQVDHEEAPVTNLFTATGRRYIVRAGSAKLTLKFRTQLLGQTSITVRSRLSARMSVLSSLERALLQQPVTRDINRAGVEGLFEEPFLAGR